MDDAVLEYLIEQNKHIPFVDRIINREQYPVIFNPDGTISSHRMMWGQSGDKYYAFPSIEMIGGELVDLQKAGINPFENALQTKNYMEFSTPEEAEGFTQNYKRYWEMPSYKSVHPFNLIGDAY